MYVYLFTMWRLTKYILKCEHIVKMLSFEDHVAMESHKGQYLDPSCFDLQ